MARDPLQVLVLLFRRLDKITEYALLQRADDGVWHGVAGGAEGGETAVEAAVRETREEAGVIGPLYRLDCVDSVPARLFAARPDWGPACFVVKQHYFAMDLTGAPEITLSNEHWELRWLSYPDAYQRLHYDGNRTALEELNERILTGWLNEDRRVL